MGFNSAFKGLTAFFVLAKETGA